MEAVIWGEPVWIDPEGTAPAYAEVGGTTKAEYIEVAVHYYPGLGTSEFEVNIWSGGQSSGSKSTYQIIGRGGIDRGKEAAEQLLREGLERL